jgi:thiamine-monophosphate kinase
VDVVAVGNVAAPVLRSGAEPDQEVWVTGELGGAAAAVEGWLAGQEPERAARLAYTRPPSRAGAAIWLRERDIPTAMIDLSDGIAGDAAHLAAASGVRVVIRAPDLPVSAPARGPDAIRLAAAGGEDYELCFTARAGSVAAVKDEFEAAFGVRLSRVGVTEQGSGAIVVDDSGNALDVRGFQHWGRE